nr:hypothetical protein [Prevotella sp.]
MGHWKPSSPDKRSWNAAEKRPTAWERKAKSYYPRANEHKQHALKGQKLLAQGSALGYSNSQQCAL